MLSDIIQTASSLHIRGFSGGRKEELGDPQSDPSHWPEPDISCLSVVDPQLALDDQRVQSEHFQALRTFTRSRGTQKSITRKSDGRKSSAPKKLSVLEDENVGEKTLENLDVSRYSILGSYLNSCKTPGPNINPSDTPEGTQASSGLKL